MSHRTKLLVLTALLFGLSLWVLLHGLPGDDGAQQQILWQLRLPLVLTAWTVGAGLAVSAALLQVLLKNPLADPGIIGISSGASLFAALFLLTGFGASWVYGLPVFAFIGAMLTTLLIYFISKRLSFYAANTVILAGIAVSTLAGGIIAWLYFFSDAQSLRNLTFWLLGSLHQADLTLALITLPVALVLLAYVTTQSSALNWLYLGHSAAQLRGLDMGRFYPRILLVSAMLVGIAVSLAGSIAFVGLLVPHLLRLCWGHDNRLILPASALTGAILMLIVILASRAFGGVAVPVSMLTATVGGPLFLYIIIRQVGR
ncbi:Vitamin B12 import system permease protein BtuC [Saliniradius amylolyticus]|uniref:Vitamin B12 import system permease protein BtuC n=1 Tax=Saliniradius amylolyticus TaxID=2183582 RepID=A0A2S2E481_9ALTE|nr:iron chelate uptake ABC transporter family permease subunit [Saliniradius amylolyticus]AWL11817.1 Vitamin B12 import system permease protein BtuC [Saliniradius amylolyticus]